ncbi:MAG: HEAT repeat domain-containing protein [Deltaproteobacteria bacterium]|nr:HEAT repeat domain-containing protein [Deltaproteobacteria bacterium]
MRQLTGMFTVAALVVAVAACDSGPKPGEEGAYWGKKLTTELAFGKKDSALKHLVEVKDKGSLPFLYEELKAPLTELRPQIVELISVIGDETSIEPLVNVIDPAAGAGRDKEGRIKANTNEKAIKALSRLSKTTPAVAKNEKVISTVQQLLNSNSLDVQLAAIVALGDLQAKASVPELIKIADGHPNNFMVKNAAEALLEIGDAAAADVMGKLLFFERDGVSFYRESSYALFVFGKGSLPVLKQIYDGQFKAIEQLHIDPLVQKTKAVVVYGDLADPSTFDVLTSAANTEGSLMGEALLRIEGQRASGRIGLDKVAAGLKKQMDNVDISQSEHALAGLVQLGHKEIAAPLWSITSAEGYLKNCKSQDNTDDQCKFNEQQVRKARLLNYSRVAPGADLANFTAAANDEKNPKLKPLMEAMKARIKTAADCEGKGASCFAEKLKDPEPLVRDRAAYELLWINTDESRDALVTALTDKDNEVRYAAIMGVLRRLPKDGVALADKVKAQLAEEKGQTQYVRINEDLKRLEIRLRRGY